MNRALEDAGVEGRVDRRAKPVVLAFPSAAQEEDDQHRREQPPPPVEPETSGYPEEYKVMSLGPAGHAPRLWLKGKWGEMFPSLPWNPRPAILVDLDRETGTIPQSIDIHSMRGMARVEGFNLEALAEWLNAQHVTKILAVIYVRDLFISRLLVERQTQP